VLEVPESYCFLGVRGPFYRVRGKSAACILSQNQFFNDLSAEVIMATLCLFEMEQSGFFEGIPQIQAPTSQIGHINSGKELHQEGERVGREGGLPTRQSLKFAKFR